jgi:hypothetical protein
MIKKLIKLSTKPVLTRTFMHAIIKIINLTAFLFSSAEGDRSFLII